MVRCIAGNVANPQANAVNEHFHQTIKNILHTLLHTAHYQQDDAQAAAVIDTYFKLPVMLFALLSTALSMCCLVLLSSIVTCFSQSH